MDHDDTPDKPRIEAAVAHLTPGKLNVVRGAFKVGVKPSQIARQFGLSQSDVRKALASDGSRRAPDHRPQGPACHLSVCRADLGVSRKMERRFSTNVSLKTRSLTAPRRSSSNSCSGKSSGRVTSFPLGHQEKRISICPSFLTHNRSIRQSLISALANSFAYGVSRISCPGVLRQRARSGGEPVATLMARR